MLDADAEVLSPSPAEERGAAAHLRRGVADYLPAVLTVTGLVVLWELSYTFVRIPRYILPAPSAILERMYGSFGLLMMHSWVTLQEIIFGFLAGTALGIALALLIVQSRMLAKTLYSLIVASQVVPKIAIAPLFVIWFGYGMMPKVAITMLLAFFPVVVACVTGLLSVSPDTLNVMRSVAATRWQIFTKIMFPHSLPYLFSGLKVGITLSVVGAVVGEWVGADAGLGYLIQIANSQLDTVLLFAALVILVIIGVVSFGLIALVERLLMPWHQPVDISATM
jgi:NitT/TauT family transport system permease protein